MSKIFKIIFALVLIAAFTFLMATLIQGHTIAVLNPQGVVADRERDLIIFTVLLGLIVVVPVIVLLFVFAWRYREGNTKAKYSPKLDHNSVAEIIWWGIPCLIILALGIVTFRATRELDPTKALASDVAPLNIQVVSLQWKWLFIYPDEQVATINDLKIPEKTPVHFTITADSPMNSFWIPSLGGQIYAMTGMSTQLNLMADHTGTYRGSSANISGTGFAGMHFTADSVSRDNFDKWVDTVQTSSNTLSFDSYNILARPSQNEPNQTFVVTDKNLYDKVIDKYMPATTTSETSNE